MNASDSTHESPRIHRFHAAALAGAAGLCLGGQAAGQLAVTGQWESPLTCWPDGSMHANHVVIRDSQNQLTGRILMWYSPGCPFTAETVNCGTWDPPLPGCPSLPTGCQQASASLLGCPQMPLGCWGSFPTSLSPRLWNPADNSVVYYQTPLTPGLFEVGGLTSSAPCQIINDCNGHAELGDGRLLVVGGGCGPDNADDDVLIFDPANINAPGGPWTQQEPMVARRWYPTAVTLPDGRVMVFSGESAGSPVEIPEIYNPWTDTWTTVPSANKVMYTYPYMFVLPSGKIFWGGFGFNSAVLDMTSATPTWTDLPDVPVALFASSGSAVTYAPGKVLKCGGFNPEDCPPNQRTAVIDFNVASPAWSSLDPQMNMVHDRKDHTLVALPDGHVLAVGGRGDCIDTCPGPSISCANCVPERHAEWCDPTNGLPVWSLLAEATVPRGYHSTAVLLSDGRVLASGGENAFGPASLPVPGPVLSSRSGEIFKPPYLFNTDNTLATRPMISTAPEKITYGGNFAVTMPAPQASSVTKVSFVRVGSPTHSFDQNQRLVPTTFSIVNNTTVRVASPPNANHAPPGYYMLFVMRDNGAHKVPSIAKYVLITPCAADVNGDCLVDGFDLALLQGDWDSDGYSPCPLHRSTDLNFDCKVDGLDLALLLGAWGNCPSGCGAGGSSLLGGGEFGGESAASSSPSGPTAGCGGSLETFLEWLATENWAAFELWYQCVTGGL